jgi:hypothetical protein
MSKELHTPETDHLETELGQTALQAHPVIWEHSRKLERERDEARHDFEVCRNKWDIAVTMAARAENERDEALKYLKWIHDLAESQRKWAFRNIAKEGLLMKWEG